MSKKMNCVMALAAAVCLASLSAARGDEFGSLKGQIKYVGQPKPAAPINVGPKGVGCGNNPLFDESLVIGKNGEVANVVVWLKNKPGVKLAVDPAVEKALPIEVKLDNKGCRFAPHIVAVNTNQTLNVTNSDAVGHNTNGAPFVNPGFNPLLQPGQVFPVNFMQPESIPFKVICNMHPWMAGWVMVRDNPFVAVTGDNGKFEIKGIPAGEYDFVFWQEKGGYLKEI